MNKNQKFEGVCVDYTYNGLGVVKYDTFCVFVKDMVIGEKGEIIVTAVKKDYGYGRLLKLIEASPERQKPLCPVSRQCGGCQLQHISAKGQREFKQNHVEQTLKNIGKLDVEVEPILTMEVPYYYRNKIQLPVKEVEGKIITGFYRNNSHEIIETEKCYLQTEHGNYLVDLVKELLEKYHIGSYIRHLMIRDFPASKQSMVVLVTKQKEIANLSALVEELVSRDNLVKTVVQSVNDKETNVVLGDKEIVLYGDGYITDILSDLKFEVSAHSFYQVNTKQTEVLYNTAISLANISKDDMVMDLYCGVGTIGLLASKQAGKVIGVEIVEDAVKNAKRNAEINGIDNISFICGDTKKVLEQLKGEKVDVVFVDPPRKGCSVEALNGILEYQANKIVYISCNPSTLARDLRVLVDEGYEIEKVQPVDMFPQSYHVETVVLLRYQGNRNYIYVK